MARRDKRDIGRRVSDLGALDSVLKISPRLDIGRKTLARNFHMGYIWARKK